MLMVRVGMLGKSGQPGVFISGGLAHSTYRALTGPCEALGSLLTIGTFPIN